MYTFNTLINRASRQDVSSDIVVASLNLPPVLTEQEGQQDSVYEKTT